MEDFLRTTHRDGTRPDGHNRSGRSKRSRREVARALPLEQVTLKSRDACNDAIWINAADGFAHEILEPIHIKLKRNAQGGFNPVQIDGETGTTILHFRPTLKPTVMDGLAKT